MLNSEYYKSQIELFRIKGYCLIPGYLDAKQILELWTEIYITAFDNDSICTYEQTEDGAKMLHRIYCPMSVNPRLATYSKLSEIELLVDSLWDESSILLTDKVNMKKPGGTGFQAHCDMQGVFKNFVNDIISVFICLDECTIENGCLEVYDIEKKEYCPIFASKGDIILLNGWLLHKSGKNNSTKSRTVYIIIFNKKSEGNHRNIFTEGAIKTNNKY